MKIRLLAFLILGTLLPFCRAAAQPTALLPEPGEYIVPPATLPFIPGQTVYRQGGFSGLFHAGGNEFWTITDRGPNVDFNGNIIFLVPSFQLRMFKIRLNPNGSVAIIDSLTITRPGGGATSGLPNPAPYSTGEIPYDGDHNVLQNDDWGFDTEGILIAPDGTFWICEEYAPGIAQVASNGQVIRRVRPQPTGGLPDILKRRRPNRGCEGIVMTPNGKIYTIVQSGMENSYSGTDAADVSASQQTEMLRLVEYDPATGGTRMFAYMMDAGYPTGGSNIRRRDVKIGDMAAVNDNEILLIEHAERGNGNVKRVYKIDLRGATPISQEAFETSPGTFKSLEELSRAQITSVAGITPVGKTLLLDLRSPSNGNPAWPAEADKPEGLAIVNSTTIVVCNDNDFGVLSPNEDGNFIFTGKQLHSLVYHLDTPLDFKLGAQGYVQQGTSGVQTGTALFVNDYQCIGETVSTLPMSIHNTGAQDIVIYGADFFQMDTTVVQGNQGHPLKRTPEGALIRANEYSMTEQPGAIPSSSAIPPRFPIVIAPGQTWNFYLNFTPDRRGSRYARGIFRSNMVGTFGIDPIDGKQKEGLMSVDLFGHGMSGLMQTKANYVFPSIEPGNFHDTMIVIRNTGDCDLHIAHDVLSIDAGDADDFHILSALPHSTIDAKKNYVIPSGGSDSILVRFTPKQQGSRRATITLRTNDSSLYYPAITERGSFYIDLYGVGIASLRVRPITLPPAVIGATSASGTLTLENNSITSIDVVRVDFVGDANGELKGERWPTFPKTIPAGGTLNLGILFTPNAGDTPGATTRKVRITLDNGTVLETTVTVIAGTRELTVTPTSLFNGSQVPVGEISRRTIIVTNLGTLPVTLGQVTIGGPNASNYLLGPIPRRTIEPGQQEFIEVTFKPSAGGSSTGTVTIPSNATNGPHNVTLGGSSSSTRMPEDATPGSAFASGTHYGFVGGEGTSLRIAAILPQPARDEVRVEYSVPGEMPVAITLYDMLGTPVYHYEAGTQSAGKYDRTIDLRSLPAGLYYARLTAGAGTVSTPVIVAR